jgi:deoxyribodipyrimidine photolyase-related protein
MNLPSHNQSMATRRSTAPIRHLVLILGDQLDQQSAALTDFDTKHDVVLMAEVADESTHVWSSQARIAFFLSAMRHFARALAADGIRVEYAHVGKHAFHSMADALSDAIQRLQPTKVVLIEPGEWRLEQALRDCCQSHNTDLAVREDTHFLISRQEFATWARAYKQLRMEYFYRMMRKRHDVLMENGEPLGGRWNFDAENRGAFSKSGPGDLPAPPQFAPDAITREVFADIEAHFPKHPGSVASFQWAVTRESALVALGAFVRERLAKFGEFQDAMWSQEPYLYHSLISAALNVKLLNPREVIAAAANALEKNEASIESVEGFIRQILGWREFIRGVYWLDMPAMREANVFNHQRALPAWYWSGATNMNCMKQTIGQTLDTGYAHHIQRLMVTGNFGLLAEIKPQDVEDWYLAVYIDAVEWAELPNVAGMALYANDGRFTSKPYIASGAYIKRMSNYCGNCRYRPEVKTGPSACPFTTFYWHFLDKHESTLASNPRTSLMVRNLTRMSDSERAAIRDQAKSMLNQLDTL